MSHGSRYLGSVFTYDNDCSQDLRTRIGKGTEITKSMETTAFNTVLYGHETRIYNKKIRDKLLAFELRCY